jgi:GNAT superfamily N-acetyltransferase
MPAADLICVVMREVSDVCGIVEAWKLWGNQVEEHAGARFVTNPGLPVVHDANLVCGVRAESEAEIDAVLAHAERVFAAAAHRRVLCDPFTPPAFEARLALEGYRSDETLQLLLTGSLRAASRAFQIRLVETDADWESLRRLLRSDHLEEAEKFEREAYNAETTQQLTESKRSKCPPVRFWIASDGGTDCAFFGSAPAVGGVGLVEDLFTHPAFRHRGFATALISHAVEDTRSRGAGAVVIGAEVGDTPKEMYAALGFRPVCITRGWLKKVR